MKTMDSTKFPYRVALLTNFIPPYQTSFYQEIARRVKELLILVSTPMEPNRSWEVDWETLHVRLQKTITISETWKHPQGFSEPLYVHIPYDTFFHLNKFRPDCVISTELGMRTLQAVGFHKIFPSSKLIIRTLLSEQSELGRGKLRYYLRSWLLQQADRITVDGESGARYIRKFGIPEKKIIRVPTTIGLTPFLSLPIEPDHRLARRLLYVGQFVPRKGILEFLSIFRNWLEIHQEGQLEICFVGDGPLMSNLRDQSFPKNVSLKIMGYIPYKELPNLYSEASILFFPTLSDEWGMVVNEAMASGLPVLGSLYSQAVEELVENDVTGWTFHPDRPEEVLLALDHALLCSQDNLNKMRLAARNRICSISPEAAVEILINEIARIL
jgi:glycosyltransferase involved in cell wall biosynthesis